MGDEQEVNQGTRDEAPAPIVPIDTGAGASLLIYGARGLKQGVPIDAVTGGHGWSHLALDVNEVDSGSGRRVIIDNTVGVGIHRRFFDTPDYVDRPLAQVELPRQLGEEIATVAKRLVGAPYSAASVFRHRGAGDRRGTVCSQVVYEALPPDVQRLVLGVSLGRGRLTNLLRRTNPHLATPNHFAIALQLPPAAEVGPEGLHVDADTVRDRLLRRGSRGIIRRPGRRHEQCRLRASVVAIGLQDGSADLGDNWRFDFDVNGRGPNTIRSRTLSVIRPSITPRKILLDDFGPPCPGRVPIHIVVHATQRDGIDDHGSVMSPGGWTVECPGSKVMQLSVFVDGNHEGAVLDCRFLVRAWHRVQG